MNEKCGHGKKLHGEECILCEKLWYEMSIRDHTKSLERAKRKLAEVNEKLSTSPASPL